MQAFVVCFYRGGPNGPIVEYEDVEARNVTAVRHWARAIARERGWRVMSLVPGKGGKTAFLQNLNHYSP